MEVSFLVSWRAEREREAEIGVEEDVGVGEGGGAGEGGAGEGRVGEGRAREGSGSSSTALKLPLFLNSPLLFTKAKKFLEDSFLVSLRGCGERGAEGEEDRPKGEDGGVEERGEGEGAEEKDGGS